jgi:AraC family transcriptional regulator, L-rhamnose operon regulatory protein RhaS
MIPFPMRAEYSISQAEVSLSADRPVRATPVLVTSEVRPHDHDYYEICLVSRGRAEHATRHYCKPLQPGSVLVVPPGEVHALRSVRRLEVINLYYLAEWLLFDLRSLWEQSDVVPLFLSAPLFRSRIPRPIPQCLLPEPTLAACLRELADLQAELAGARPSIVFLKSSLLKLFTILSRAFAAQDPPEKTPFRPEVAATLESIERCLAENTRPAIATLARSVHLSEDHLGKLFRHATGRTINDYYQQRRVHTACNLLLSPATPMADILFSLGYADAPHFCRMFKRYTGDSPRAWRQRFMPAPAR